MIRITVARRAAGEPLRRLAADSGVSHSALCRSFARPEVAAKVRAAEGITWRTWFDGGGVGGPIATRWEVELWPTVFLLDKKGVVRHVWVGWPPETAVEAAITALLAGK